MDANIQGELLNAVLSKFASERDEAFYRIAAILSSDYNDEIDQVEMLKREVDIFTKAKLNIEQVGILCQNIFTESKEKQPEKPETHDDPS